jgi:alanine-glyoxylate transaminase/serine-glyoxylate transaminase/serine-pyruvate transaminase
MEVAIANMASGDPVLVCVNGYFDCAWLIWLNVTARTCRPYCPWGEVFTADEVKAALEEYSAKIVAIVHAETSTGALQPLDEIAEVVHEHSAILIVDAVTSLGGMPVRVDEVGIDVCYSGSQKCLSCPPRESDHPGSRAMEILETPDRSLTVS